MTEVHSIHIDLQIVVMSRKKERNRHKKKLVKCLCLMTLHIKLVVKIT